MSGPGPIGSVDGRCVSCERSSTAVTGYCRTCGDVRLVELGRQSDDELAPAQERTPVRRSRVPGIEGVALKIEGALPGGSFKDRVMRLLVRAAVRAGAPGAIVASSGNAAVSAAAACAELGVPLLVLVPLGTGPERTAPAVLRGAVVLHLGEDPSAAVAEAARLGQKFGLVELASTFASPGCEYACRQIGRELVQQLGADLTDVVAPVSAGPVLVGTGHGILETAGRMPRLVAAQAAGCSPLARAFDAGAPEVRPWSGPVSTRAVAIADRLTGYPQDGTYTLRLIRASGGFAAAVDDEEMAEMRHDLAVWDGLDVELSACAGAAVWRRFGRADPARVVCLLTANGLKDTLRAAPSQSRSIFDYCVSTEVGESLVEELRGRAVELPA